MLKITDLFIFCCALVFCNSCYIDSDSWVRCTTLEELSRQGPRNWYSLYITGNARQNYVSANEKYFSNTLNVVNILASRILNDVGLGTFSKLNRLYWLKLTENQIHTLHAGSFDNPTLEIFIVENCDVWDIEVGIFKKLPKLREAWITGNKIPYLKTNCFESNTIQKFSLRDNNIQYIESGAFNNLPNLTYLLLHSNRLQIISRDMFTGVPNMNSLLLHLNLIETIEDYAFADLKEIVNLDISNNRLTELSADIFPRSGNKLFWFFIHNNLLTYLTPEFLDRLPALGRLSMIGNPWHCRCLNNLQAFLKRKNVISICDQEVKSGSRPMCVKPIKNTMCTYDSTANDEIMKYYQKIIREYPQLPPICQTRARDEPKLEPVNQ